MTSYGEVRIGEVIRFGSLDFRVLDVAEGKALVISDKIVEKRVYGLSAEWEGCELRQYLNGPFFNDVFTAEEQARIIAGKDRVFLLSPEETVRYFGDSGQLAAGKKYIDDEYNQARIAENKDTGKADWWFLRSSGSGENLAVCVGDNGGVYVFGHGITVEKAGAGGVRPALWIAV